MSNMDNAQWDRWAAEKVMGWKRYTAMGNEFWMVDCDTMALPVGHDFHPSTDLNHLWMVVERMRDLEFNFCLITRQDGANAVCFTKKYYFSGKADFDNNINIGVLMAAKKALEDYDE